MSASLLLLLLLASAPSQAARHQVVRPGQTIDSIAAALGDPALAAVIRQENGVAPGAEVPVGTVLRLPVRPGDQDQEAMLVSFHGSGQVLRPGQPALPFGLGLSLGVGTLVCTDPDSTATVRLGMSEDGRDHDDILLLGSTCVTVRGSTRGPSARESLVEVRDGSIAVHEGFGDDLDGTVTVLTPSGLATGTGGGFRVHIEPGAARTEALTEPVAVLGGGAEVQLRAGQGSRVRTGEAPGAPVDLLLPGTPLLPAEDAPLRFADFSWSAVDRALGYRVELAVSPAFDEVVVTWDVGLPAWRPDLLLVPYRVPGLWWRVSAFDRTGFLGLPSEGRHVAFPEGVGP
jgi:hypothetical protein